jgi:hypothetical protein
MKKFIASENIAMATSRQFKDSIQFACTNTENNRQFPSSRWDKSFVGTVVTFNPSTNDIDCFNFYAHVDLSNGKEVNQALHEFLEKLSTKDGHSNLEFITLVEAINFEYHGHVGYMTEQERMVYNLKLENIFMTTYINIVTGEGKDFSFDNSPKIEEMDFSMRTFKVLKRAGINTVQQIKNLSQVEVMKIRNLGWNSYNELESKLNITFK